MQIKFDYSCNYKSCYCFKEKGGGGGGGGGGVY